MTEEQRKQCEEIIDSREIININLFEIIRVYLFYYIYMIIPKAIATNLSIAINMTISLAKVFNKDITEKEAIKTIANLYVCPSIKKYDKFYRTILTVRLFMPLINNKEYDIKSMGWRIANYFDKRKK
ncbi:hypothetical protein [Brachyspira sp.]|uniref:hypothetical protein n=1 Tax=Brachyspira sp. TaxID=1977261 RepID=UPI003D7C9597